MSGRTRDDVLITAAAYTDRKVSTAAVRVENQEDSGGETMEMKANRFTTCSF